MKSRFLILFAFCIFLIVPGTSALAGNWSEVNASAQFPLRYQQTSVVYDDNLWVIGGYDTDYFNDTWHSGDGNLWYPANLSAEFPARTLHTSVVNNNRMWVIGGVSGGYLKNDVWYSSDGIIWLPANLSAGFPARGSHASTVFNNRMWVIGGQGYGGSLNDVWYSSDGNIWHEATPAAGFSPRTGHSVLTFDNKLWVIGGNDGSDKKDVWYSSDGIIWTEATPAAAFPARYCHASAVYDNRMWVIGGLSGGHITNDAWYSSDGVTWTDASIVSAALSREGQSLAVQGSSLWLIGGYDGTTNKNDTWIFRTAPVAGFTAIPVSGTVPFTVTFMDASTGYPASYAWEFGDGSTGTGANPTHTYTSVGTYTVNLTVNNPEGRNSMVRSGYISAYAPAPQTDSGDDPAVNPESKGPVQQVQDEIPVNIGQVRATSVISATVTGVGIRDIVITATKAEGPGKGIAPPPGIVYEYDDIEPAHFTEITRSEIRFYVMQSWLDEHHFTYPDVVMYHYTGDTWKALPTTFDTVNGGHAFFTALTPGFSRFAITGQFNSTAGPGNVTLTATTVSVEENRPGPVDRSLVSPAVTFSANMSPVFPAGKTIIGISIATLAIIGAVLVLVIVAAFFARRWWIVRQNPALFRKYK
jgi:PGF-pre-PGF domain-containing protein